jgi:exoribonuclease II
MATNAATSNQAINILPAPSLPQVGGLVMYENDGQPVLAVVTGSNKGKFAVLNEKARTADFAGNRLYILPGTMPSQCSSDSAKASHLAELRTQSQASSSTLELAELWEVVAEDSRDYSVSELCELLLGSNTLENHLTLRLALLADSLYFRRKKDDFTPRTQENVDELKRNQLVLAERAKRQSQFVEFLVKRLEYTSLDIDENLGDQLNLLKRFAASDPSLDASALKEAKQLLEEVATAEQKRSKPSAGSESSGTKEMQAYRLLRRTQIFDEYSNIYVHRHQVPVEFSEAELKEADDIIATLSNTSKENYREDYTTLDAFTIDDVTTRDMDDALSLTPRDGGYLLGIHITDVASTIAPESILDRCARNRTTSLYLGDMTVNMLPRSLSEAALSLVAGVVRPCLSVLCELDTDLNILNARVAPTLIKVQTRYSYDEVDDLLHHSDKYLSMLYNIACNREAERYQAGGFRIHRKEIQVTRGEDNVLALKEISETSPARSLIGEMMILANETMARFASEHSIPYLYRTQAPRDASAVVDTSGIPEGAARDFADRQGLKPSVISLTPSLHATLGLTAYSQATSPIRRLIDLLHQRQLLGYLKDGKPYYSADELWSLWLSTEHAGNRGYNVSKETIRFWQLKYLEQRSAISKNIEATVVKTDGRFPLIELDELHMTTTCQLKGKLSPGNRLSILIKRVDAIADELRLEHIS